MDLSPECQSLSFGPGLTIGARVFRRTAEDPPQRRYHHFHPAAELVWFRRATAVLHLGSRRHATGGGQLVYLPSMTPHDFDVARQETEFVLFLFDPAHEDRLRADLRVRLRRGPHILTATSEVARRIDLLADWLLDVQTAPGAADTGARLLDLILLLLAEGGTALQPPVAADGAGPAAVARLSRAVSLVHADPARPWSLAEVAQACNLSPAYFARLFRAQMHMTFGEYLRTHRLNVAAGLVASSDLPIAQVAYQSGFGSPAHLSNRFADRFGMSPSDYRAAARTSPVFVAGAQGGANVSPE